eukprot:COSAG02_NODE_4385_length_5421_cov_4.928035_7_plen_40_part_00
MVALLYRVSGGLTDDQAHGRGDNCRIDKRCVEKAAMNTT